MAPDVLVLMSIGGVSFIASYLTLRTSSRMRPEPVGPVVTYCVPPPLMGRRSERSPRPVPPPLPPRRTGQAPHRWVLEWVGGEWQEWVGGEWQAGVERLADSPERMWACGQSQVVTDLRWSGAVALPKREKSRWKIEPGRA